ncbi:hypothetical protein B0J13DRAFT_289342 [Dactylonectria estremocensis]|uniref:Cell surface protein n=1 Tax=Dactylonectria estremocensis TaxID=1079267 RepID=A0A9P9F169_9HYPO|nr:hypothetical protein B0J13DRAFT_289342 [Dactylonectria estremocensis]
MRYQFITAALITAVSGHGVVTSVEGANGVSMPGLSVADGTPRDCSSNGCGSQADTSIIRDSEIESGEVGPLGRTEGNGPVDASVIISNFMGAGNGAANAPPVNNGTGTGVEDDIPDNIGDAKRRRAALATRRAAHRQPTRKRQLGKLLGGLGGGAGGGGAGGVLGGLFGGGEGDAEGTKSEQPQELSVAATAGEGSNAGLPTASDDGVVTLMYRQINQDGAGPLTADVDGTSGGTDAAAFQTADVAADVPGIGFGGLSLATNTDFPVQVQMPAGMTCDASVGGADNVCIVRVRNSAGAGPFGGSGAFTQTAAARKRAIAYRLKKRTTAGRK